MSISSFSVFNALLVYSIMLGAICLMCKWTDFLEKGGGPVLWVASIVAVLRMVLPFEIPLTHEIRFWNLLGAPQRFFRTYPIVVQVLLVVWAVGAAVFIIRDFWMLHLAYKKCRSYTTKKSEHVQEIAARVGINCPVVLSPDVEIPYVMGIFRYTIYLPYSELSERDTELILRHEAQHIKSHDVWIRLGFGILSEFVWWNFLARPFQNAVDKILELRCDANVTKGMTEEEKSEYLTMLLRISDRVVDRKEGLALAMNEFGVVEKKKTTMHQRFRVIDAVRKGRSSRYVRPIATCLVLILFFASYLVIFQAASAPMAKEFRNDSEYYYLENYDGPEIDEGMNNAFILKESDGRYQLCIDYRFVRYLTENEVNSDKYKDLYIYEVNKQ